MIDFCFVVIVFVVGQGMCMKSVRVKVLYLLVGVLLIGYVLVIVCELLVVYVVVVVWYECVVVVVVVVELMFEVVIVD